VCSWHRVAAETFVRFRFPLTLLLPFLLMMDSWFIFLSIPADLFKRNYGSFGVRMRAAGAWRRVCIA